MMSSDSISKGWRDQGNKSYEVYQQSEDNKRQKTYLEAAVASYYRAFETADNADDRSSASKNHGTASWRLATVLNALKEKSALIDFRFREAIKYFSKATVDGRRSKTAQWMSVLAKSYESCVSDGIEYVQGRSHRDRVVALENYVGVMCEETQLARCFMEMATVLSQAGYWALASKDCRSALQAFHDCYRPVQECLRLSSGSGEVFTEASVIEKDVQFHMCTAEALQAIMIGDETLKSAVDDYETLNINMVYNAIDSFQQAVIATKEVEVEIEAIAVSRLGSLFDKFGKSLYIIEYKEKAKLYFNRSMQLASSLHPRNCTAEPWYKVCAEALQRYQRESVVRDESAQQEERAAYIKELEEEIKDIKAADVGSGRSGAVSLLRHLYKTYPPKNDKHQLNEEALTAALEDTEMKSIKKVLVTAIQHYHPDKQDKEKFGMKWCVLCEEITKVLNNRHDIFKIPD